MAIHPNGTRFYALCSSRNFFTTYPLHEGGLVWMQMAITGFRKTNQTWPVLPRDVLLTSSSSIFGLRFALTSRDNSSFYRTLSFSMSPGKQNLWFASPSLSEYYSCYLSVFQMNLTSDEIVKELFSVQLDASGGNLAQGAKSDIEASPFGDN
ncbi:hypothetical protein K469DRAFT_755101 [Zopfia rhizophila CBS 207.26]|uniref:Uncharacterized protein n=1 Tax=Zopfia rhizophila CBS 207.26 TaxID=1314779 RepID=A0A6A6DIQ8_9PEZI|nr:hypothetical protein K469DRAFT_755101 [Zopfia rhizophila CBS 207.26]